MIDFHVCIVLYFYSNWDRLSDFAIGLISVIHQDDVDALFMYNACKGLGTDEATLVELLAPRRNDRIRSMKAKYTARYDQPLIDRLNSELSGNLKVSELLNRRIHHDLILVGKCLSFFLKSDPLSPTLEDDYYPTSQGRER